MPATKKSIAGLLPKKSLLGVVHLPALPGAPGYGGKLDPIRHSMRRDLLALNKGGAHAVIIENFGDAPFAADSAGPAAVACPISCQHHRVRSASHPLRVPQYGYLRHCHKSNRGFAFR